MSGKVLFINFHFISGLVKGSRKLINFQTLTSFYGNCNILPYSINNGIVDCISLGKQRAPDGGQGADFII